MSTALDYLFGSANTRVKTHLTLVGYLVLMAATLGLPLTLMVISIVRNPLSLLGLAMNFPALLFELSAATLIICCYYVILSAYFANLKRLNERERQGMEQ